MAVETAVARQGHLQRSRIAASRGASGWGRLLAGSLVLVTATSGCMALSPQLAPTDFAALEQVEDRATREALYAEQSIHIHAEPQGTRYTKGTDPAAPRRSWQSLDAVLRSDANASAALPSRVLRLSRVFTGLTIAAAIVTVAGVAASAREGLDLGELNSTGALLLGGGLATVGLGITSGVLFGKARRSYEEAVDVYNDSLGLRLGVLDANGAYIPPRGTIVDAQGFIVAPDGTPVVVPPGAPAPLPAPGPALPPEPAPVAPPQLPPQPSAPPELPPPAASEAQPEAAPPPVAPPG